jgi:hypothetical protein
MERALHCSGRSNQLRNRADSVTSLFTCLREGNTKIMQRAHILASASQILQLDNRWTTEVDAFARSLGWAAVRNW